MGEFNENRFIFHETFMNTNGKTSGSGFIGVILGLVAAASFLAAIVGYFLEIPDTLSIMNKILEISLISASLLGVRKIAGVLTKKTIDSSVNLEQDAT